MQTLIPGCAWARGREGRQRRSRLMGFSHRVYKSYEPRAKLIKRVVDPRLKIALEEFELVETEEFEPVETNGESRT